jgi:hypothetical protein
LLSALAATIACSTLATSASPVQAGQCSKKTGGDNDHVMWTGTGYTCAYTADSGKKKIGSWATQTWTSSTAPGYTKRDHRWQQTGGVTITYMYFPSNIGSSVTFSAWNGKTSSRHWAANVIWQTSSAGSVDSSQYASGDYTYTANRFYVSTIAVTGANAATAGSPVPYTVTVRDPDGGTTPAGSAALFRQVGSKPNPPSVPCSGSGSASQPGVDAPVAQAPLANGVATLVVPPKLAVGSYTLYAVYTGTPGKYGVPLYCATPGNDGLTGAQSASWPLTVSAPAASARAVRPTTDPTVRGTRSIPATLDNPLLGPLPAEAPSGRQDMVVNDRRIVLGRDRASSLKQLACPSGYVTLQLNAASANAVLPDGLIRPTTSGPRLNAKLVPAGTKIDVQQVCRLRTGRVTDSGRTLMGTAHGDRLTTKRAGATVLAGLGDDRVRVTKTGATAFGFLGEDRITVTTAKGAAHGGPGDDRLEATTSGDVLLVGGLGRDTLIGARGATRINARDGMPGDRVTCRSDRNRVRIDAGDTVEGPCTVVKG